MASMPTYMLMLLLALAGGASFVIRRHMTNLTLRSSSWVMAKSFSQMGLMVRNGCIAVLAKSVTIFNVSLHKQNNKLKLKDGHLNANLMSAKVIKFNQITPPISQGRSTKWVNQSRSLTLNLLSAELWLNRSSQRWTGMAKGSEVLMKRKM